MKEDKKEDQLLRALAQVAKDEKAMADARLDERWDRLSAGTLEPEEEAELRALAETSAEAREAWEAFQPLSADFRARMVRELAARTGGVATAAPPDAGQTEALPGKVLRFERWRISGRGGFFAAVGALAAAAVLVLMVRGPGGELPPLPGYRLSLEGGVRELRSTGPDIGAEQLFAPGGRFELVLRPATAVAGPVAVRFFLAGAGEPRPVDLPAEVSASGAMRVAGEIGREIAIAPGEWTLWAVVGRPEALGDDEELRSSLGAPPAADRIFLRVTALRILESRN